MEDLEDLYENAPCGYLSLSADGFIIKANQTLCRWLDANSYNVLGKRFYDLLSVPGKIFYETHFAPLLRMQGFFNEVALDLVSPGGKQIPVLVNALERRAPDGSLLFTRVTLFQASERRRYERELVDARNAAERAKREFQGLNRGLETQLAEGARERLLLQRALLAEQEIARLREQFVAILGHDLRNPLSSIVAGLNILSKEPHSEKAFRVLSLMSNSTDRMFKLIRDMLDLARLKSGAGIAVEIQPSNVHSALEQVIEELRSAYPDQTIESRLSLPEQVYCDNERIAQVVSNLLANALTHGAKDAPIRVDAVVSGEDLTISVVNRGQPITQEIKDRLFEPFFRGKAGTQGLGLGLYISREIVRSHGGTLDIASDAQETRFFFSIPMKC